ncbi:hypothetical protein MLD38_007290 [Melastoma candidum]|uniref:Uncharacterized protein n=1 Tax=Melastoma candidum TaxID=119954 RepID=A0ACB9RSJ3_9MYRT|nr:hypothetical protein MLD38_007290 [Melastoma candidum]
MKTLGDMPKETESTRQIGSHDAVYPNRFHTAGPPNLPPPNWRDLLQSHWDEDGPRRALMACFVQAVYLLELDRQQNRSDNSSLAPYWWLQFRYKLVRTLFDDRDGSIFGTLLEWDRSNAMSSFIVVRPAGLPKAVLALRGTILKSPTILRDFEDDFRFLIQENLKGSRRFSVTLDLLRSVIIRHGSSKVCIAGHSLGAGFALQVGKALAKEGIYVDAHLFNPPAISLARGLGDMKEKAARVVWKKLRLIIPSSSKNESDGTSPVSKDKNRYPQGKKQWVPNSYVNDQGYICCRYIDPERKASKGSVAAARLFVRSKGKQKFMEAHGLQQWWSNEDNKELALQSSELINKQLRSLYNSSPQKKNFK